MTALFLSDAELAELTGYRLACKQIAWLKKQGWRFVCNAAGRPRVARGYFEKRMVGSDQPTPDPTAKPDWSALQKA